MNLIKTEQKRELLFKLLEFKGEEFAVQPGKCLYGHGRGGRWGTEVIFIKNVKTKKVSQYYVGNMDNKMEG